MEIDHADDIEIVGSGLRVLLGEEFNDSTAVIDEAGLGLESDQLIFLADTVFLLVAL